MNKTLPYSTRKGSSKIYIQIVLAIMDNQFCSMKKIYKYFENKNYNTLKNNVNYLVSQKIIFKVPFWHGTAFYVNVDGDKTIKILANYHTTKHRVSAKINKITDRHPQLKEKFLHAGVKDFNQITKTNIPTKPFDVSSLDASCTTVVTHLNLIILATKILILEEKRPKENISNNLHLVKRQDRICEMWLDLESFLDKYFGKTSDEAEFMTINTLRKLENELKLYKDYFAHFSHSNATFSEYVRALRQIKLGYKKEYTQSKGISMSSASKILGKFTNKSGPIILSHLIDMRRIENASLPRFHDKDIEDLWYFEFFSDELSRTRFAYDEKSQIEKEKTRKMIKLICPDMKIVN